MLKDTSNGCRRKTSGTLADELDNQFDDLTIVQGGAGEVEGGFEDLAGGMEGGRAVGLDG